MIVIGVTGGTGCGKTVFLNQIAARGGEIVDCDGLYAELVQTDETLRSDLRAAFGSVFLSDGQLDRKGLAKIVFSDKNRLDDLNQIIYRYIGRAVRQKLAVSRAALFAIDAINLLQSGLADLCQVTVAITAPEEIRLARIMARDGLTEEAALLRIRAQEPNEFFAARCDHTLKNEHNDPAQFAKQADALLDRITKENTP